MSLWPSSCWIVLMSYPFSNSGSQSYGARYGPLPVWRYRLFALLAWMLSGKLMGARSVVWWWASEDQRQDLAMGRARTSSTPCRHSFKRVRKIYPWYVLDTIFLIDFAYSPQVHCQFWFQHVWQDGGSVLISLARPDSHNPSLHVCLQQSFTFTPAFRSSLCRFAMQATGFIINYWD